jgi:hypothetical protein
MQNPYAPATADLNNFTDKRRSTTKKWMPTQHGGNGHVSGVESLNKKNMEKHGSWGGMRFHPGFWLAVPAVAAFKTVKTLSDYRADKIGEEKPEEKELEWHSNENKSSLKGMKAVRSDAQHLGSSNCSHDRELWQLCVKDRFNQKVDCKARLEAFRVCQESMY